LKISATNSEFSLRFNADSGSNYMNGYVVQEANFTPTAYNVAESTAGNTLFGVQTTSGTAAETARGYMVIYNYAATDRVKFYESRWSYYTNNNSRANFFDGVNYWNSTSAITSLDITRISGSANITNNANTAVRLYGVS
jgi:hypothetical protein